MKIILFKVYLNFDGTKENCSNSSRYIEYHFYYKLFPDTTSKRKLFWNLTKSFGSWRWNLLQKYEWLFMHPIKLNLKFQKKPHNDVLNSNSVGVNFIKVLHFCIMIFVMCVAIGPTYFIDVNKSKKRGSLFAYWKIVNYYNFILFNKFVSLMHLHH